MLKILLQIISAILGLWLADKFVPGVNLAGSWQALIFIGAILGLANVYIKPILKIVTLPLRIITFGLFGLVINIAIIWLADLFFIELVIKGIIPLLWTTLIIWGLGLISRRMKN